MKNSTSLHLIIAAGTISLLISLAGCKKNNDGCHADISSNQLSATVQVGSDAPFQFSVTGPDAGIFFGDIPDLQVHTKDVNGRIIFIYLDNLSATGTYSFPNAPTSSIYSRLEYDTILPSTQSYYVDFATDYTSNTNKGSVTITALDKHYIEGTFVADLEGGGVNGTPRGVIAITNGSFKGNFRPHVCP